MKIKELFEKAENGMLTWEQFDIAAKAVGAKFADLSGGDYVSKSKYDTDIKARDTSIETLQSTITTRDTDLETLKSQLATAGADAAKLAEVNSQLASLQSKYDADTKDFQGRLEQQSYEFAVREFANTKKFTSNAAKRDFTQAMIGKKLQFENGTLVGADDFVTEYTENNADAFTVEVQEPTPAPTPVPTFVAPTPGTPSGNDDGGFHFNFTGVRPHN